jgi:hypothetical protein
MAGKIPNFQGKIEDSKKKGTVAKATKSNNR